jgi:hypothetical protein
MTRRAAPLGRAEGQLDLAVLEVRKKRARHFDARWVPVSLPQPNSVSQRLDSIRDAADAGALDRVLRPQSRLVALRMTSLAQRQHGTALFATTAVSPRAAQVGLCDVPVIVRRILPVIVRRLSGVFGGCCEAGHESDRSSLHSAAVRIDAAVGKVSCGVRFMMLRKVCQRHRISLRHRVQVRETSRDF